MSLHVLMSDESTKELEAYNESPMSMVNGDGGLTYGLQNNKINKFVFTAMSYGNVD